MKDFFGQQIQIGDEVAFEAPNYRWLVLGKVIAFTPQQVRVEYTNSWNYKSHKQMQFLTYPHTLIVKPK